jgi:hypothetical protein
MGTISGCRYLKVNLKAKIYIYVNSTIQRCPNKIIKFFRLKIFFICNRCPRHRWSTLSCEYLREFSKKLETALIVYSGAWGKLIHEKNRKSKISWHCPFKRLTWQGGKEAKLAQLELDVHVVVFHEGLVIQLASAPKFGRINRTRGCRIKDVSLKKVKLFVSIS